MVESCDVGSLPFVGDFQKFLEGTSNYKRVVNESTEFFEKKVVEGFLDKAKAGIEVPNYPQYRDMNQMFLDMIEGLGKVNGGYAETAPLTLKEGKGSIPEVSALQARSQDIFEELGGSFGLRICVTGPYTLSSLFAFRDKGTPTRLGNVLARIIDANVFSQKQGSVQVVSIDEPVFGFLDDPLLDFGSEGRENLLKAWESMAQKVRDRGAQTCLHLHKTNDELFWDVKALQIIESHADNSFYQTSRTKERLESTDKFLKASIATTDFDQLIRNTVTAASTQPLSEIDINEKIAEAWKNLHNKKIDQATFLEDARLMKERLRKTIERFGAGRVLYAGPECGLQGFPTYESAIECLRRVAKTVKDG